MYVFWEVCARGEFLSCSIGKTAPPVLEPIMVREPERRRRKPRGTFSFVGWPQWPDNEDYSFEFMRVLATAAEGASTVSECFWAARHIQHTNRASWYNAWTEVAARTRQRGDAAFEAGGLNMASGNWLRAANYYRQALETRAISTNANSLR